MLNLPTIHADPYCPSTPCTVYLLSKPLDDIRIHVILSEDGTANPALFVGANLYSINN